MRSEPLNVRSEPLNVRSKPLNVRSKCGLTILKVTTYGYMLSSYFKCIKTKIKLEMVFCYVLCQWKNAEK